jgi:hypothetical protein
MHDAAIAGAEFNSADKFVFREIHRNHKAPEHISPFGGHGERLGHFHDQVGLAQIPAFGEFGRGGKIFCIPFQHTLLGPGLDQLDLRFCETSLVHEIAMAGLGLPRRHVAAFGDGGDILGVLLDRFIIQQRKRRDLAGAMAADAILIKDGGDVFGEGGLGDRNLRRGGTDQKQ